MSADSGQAGGESSAGEGDRYATMACMLLSQALEPVQAADRPSEAGQTLLVPNRERAWSIEDGEDDRYLTVEIPEWNIPVRFFVSEGIEVEVIGADPSGVQAPMEGCPGYTDQSVIVHEWGSYVVHLRGAGELAISVIMEGGGGGESESETESDGA